MFFFSNLSHFEKSRNKAAARSRQKRDIRKRKKIDNGIQTSEKLRKKDSSNAFV